MKNLFLDERTARDIDQRVSRLHRDLDYRGGKIELVEVRALLKLDLAYYTASESGLLGEVVHKLRVGAKQVIKRPGLLLEAVRKFDLKALFVPDRKQILIDAALPDLKKRWSEGHEVLHSVIPWHADYMLGDNHVTLAPSCHERIEAEANYGTGKLFFPAAEFTGLHRAQPLNLGRIKAIAGHFGNTITSTLWRCVESDDRPSIGIIGEHPHHPRDGKPAVEHLIQSPSFAQRFGRFTESDAASLVRGYCGYRRAGPLGAAEVIVCDDNDDEHLFFAETFCNHYNTLTLAQYVSPKETRVFFPKAIVARA